MARPRLPAWLSLVRREKGVDARRGSSASYGKAGVGALVPGSRKWELPVNT